MTFCNGANLRARLFGAGPAARIAPSVDRRRGRPFTSQMSVLNARANAQY